MGAFTNWTYTNWHELNLDFIFEELKKIIDEGASLEKSVEEIFELLNNLDPKIKDAVKDKLDEWLEDGTLDEIINEEIFGELNDEIEELKLDVVELDNTKEDIKELGYENVGYIDVWRGWTIGKQGLHISGTIAPYIELRNYSEEPDITQFHISDAELLPLPMPMVEVSGNVVTDEVLATAVQLFTYRRCVLGFHVGGIGDFTGRQLLRINIQGRRAAPPESVNYHLSETEQNQIINACKSYTDKALSGERKFAYGSNFTYGIGRPINDSQGRARMECDTFVFMVVMGIPYEDSPYTNTTPSATYDYTNLVFNPYSYTWAKNWNVADEISKNRACYTWSELWRLWDEQSVFSDKTNVETGDIVIFRHTAEPSGTGSTYRGFDNIGHIGIAEVIDGEIFVYHASSSSNTGGLVACRQPLQTILDRDVYDEADMYFARLKTI